MKCASLAFVFLLIVAHTLGDTGQLLSVPLSQFRDGEHPAVGYALFGLLGVVAVLMNVASHRAERELDVGVFGLAAFFLGVIAVTPSYDLFHGLCTFLLLGLLYTHFGVLLYTSRSPLLCVYLPMPLVLLIATGLHSYGLWQKCVIVYLLLLINIHYHLTCRQPSPSARPAKENADRRAPLTRRRVVYVLDGEAAWRRQSIRKQPT